MTEDERQDYLMNESQNTLPPFAAATGSGAVFTRDQIAHAITCELDHAYAKHGKEKWSRHEFYAILKEEVDELWDAIKADHPQGQVVAEAVQVAAMCFRFLETGDRNAKPPNNQQRDQWKEMAGKLVARLRANRPIVKEEGSIEDWENCAIDELLAAYNQLLKGE